MRRLWFQISLCWWRVPSHSFRRLGKSTCSHWVTASSKPHKTASQFASGSTCLKICPHFLNTSLMSFSLPTQILLSVRQCLQLGFSDLKTSLRNSSFSEFTRPFTAFRVKLSPVSYILVHGNVSGFIIPPWLSACSVARNQLGTRDGNRI